ncbi:MAG: hypothetical protein K9I99_13360, partial [Melioribacteraceae bacterium]|nr:hypothetical protein [Melioribacteraceae bacterium]
GVVGELQFDVMKYRLLNEYGASVDFLHMQAYKAFWIKYDSVKDIEEMMNLRSNSLYYDKNKNLVFVADSQYSLQMAKQKNPKVEFLSAVEHNDQTVSLDEAV